MNPSSPAAPENQAADGDTPRFSASAGVSGTADSAAPRAVSAGDADPAEAPCDDEYEPL